MSDEEYMAELERIRLLRWRKLVARDTAIHIHPPHWSREEICHHLLESHLSMPMRGAGYADWWPWRAGDGEVEAS